MRFRFPAGRPVPRPSGHAAAVMLVMGALFLAWLLYPEKPVEDRTRTEITFWYPESVRDSVRSAIEEFERRNPQYHVVTGSATARDVVGDPTRFLLSVAGGVPPDLIFFDRFAVVEWASRGAFADLTPFIDADRNRDDGVHEENFVAAAWREPIYKGAHYAIPANFGIRAMYYNGDLLVRAGIVYAPDDPDVISGKARQGDARPPRTWEEICRKRLHAIGTARENGTIVVDRFLRRPGVNEALAPSADLANVLAECRPNDVVALVAGVDVFRARLLRIDAPATLVLDFSREQPAGTRSLPAGFVGHDCEIKVFDGDGVTARLARFDPDGGLTGAGFLPLYGDSWIYMYGWLNGAEFLSPDGTRCTLDDPRVIESLQWIVDVYDSVGGYEAASVFIKTTQSDPTAMGDAFINGRVAMRIDGDWSLPSNILAFKPAMNFGLAAPPLPERRLAAGHRPITWSSGYAYGIPSTAKQKEGAWELLRWLSSVEANQLVTEYEAGLAKARGQSFFPKTHPDKRVLAWYKKRFFGEGSAMPAASAAAFDSLVQLMPDSRFRPVTPVGARMWTEQVRAGEKAINHTAAPYEALSYCTRQVQLALDQSLKPPAGTVINWRALIAAYCCAVVAIACGFILAQERQRRLYGGSRRGWIEGFVCVSPWLLGFLAFSAGPILFSLVISFSTYDALGPARFAGLENYGNLLGWHRDALTKEIVANDPLFWKSLANTGFMIASVPLGIIAGLGLALLLNTKARGLPVYRTLFYLPAIVPAVAGFFLWLWIFAPNTGLLSDTLKLAGVTRPPNWLEDPAWAKPSLILMGLWGAGGGMIIWLAGLKEIPETLYEAAEIDGASRLQRFVRITIPMLSPYIAFNSIMGMIGILQVFDAAFVMTDGGPADATLFYAYYLFNQAFRFLNMGAASAMAWILFLAVLAITLLQLWLGKKWVHYEAN